MRFVRMCSAVVCCVMAAIAVAAERPVLLITPQGVFQSQVTNGVPGPWVPLAADVIVQGFPNTPPGPPDPPGPPAGDPIVKQIAAISKSTLRDKEDATAIAAIIDSIAKLNLSAADFKQALEMSAPIADTSLGANGRITQWVKQAVAVTTDHAKMKAGLTSAFGVTQETLDSILAAAAQPAGAAVTGEAINWSQLIAIIQMILTLLKNLGIGV